jgi:cell division protein FtsB
MNELIVVSLLVAAGLAGWFLTFGLCRQECRDLRQVADKLADKCKALEEVNETLEHNVEVLRGDSVILQQEAHNSLDRLAKVKAHYDDLARQAYDLQARLSTANRRVAALKGHNARYREQLAEREKGQ